MAKNKCKKKAMAVQEQTTMNDEETKLVDAVQEGEKETTLLNVAKDSKTQEQHSEATAPPEEAANYKASAVVFFTRTPDGAVAKVLVATEERRVDAKWIGLEGQKGKVEKTMVVFPMGRREKKDKGDSVETAKREYVEETTDFCGLARYLDFADFSKEGEKDIPTAQLDRNSPFWTGLHNMAVFFKPAGLVVLFCEVLPKEAESMEAKVTAASQESEGEPPTKKAKPEKPIGNPSYNVGKRDHVKPMWMSVDDLKAAVLSKGRAPTLKIHDEECYWFPLSVSILRMSESRQWLGLPTTATPAEKDEGQAKV